MPPPASSAGSTSWAGTFHRAGIDAAGRLGEVRSVDVPADLGAAVPVAAPIGGWLLALGAGFAHLDDADRLTLLAQPEQAAAGATRMNDAKVDPRGRFWTGSMGYDETTTVGSLYRVDLDGTVATVLTGIGVSNGLGWNAAADTMYYNDSGLETTTRFRYDAASGALTDGVVIAGRRGGAAGLVPDGLTVDDEDTVWSAWWDGGRIVRLAPDGAELGSVAVPARRTSSCCFAGPDRDLLVITTGQADGGPDEGRLYVARPGVTGPAATLFAGQLPR